MARGPFCGCGSCGEIYREKAFSAYGWGPAQPLPVAHELHETSLMFQVHPTLSTEDVRLTGEIVGEVLRQALHGESSHIARAA